MTCPHTWSDMPLDADDQAHRCNRDTINHDGGHVCDCGAIDMSSVLYPPLCALCGRPLDDHTVALYAPKAGLTEAVFPDAPGWRGVYCRA